MEIGEAATDLLHEARPRSSRASYQPTVSQSYRQSRARSRRQSVSRRGERQNAMEPSDTVQSRQTQVQETQTAENRQSGVDSAGNRYRESQVEETESRDGYED